MQLIDARIKAYQDNDGRVSFTGNAAIDVDGNPKAYGPNDTGLDFTANAGHPGNWFGVKTNSLGQPLVRVIDGQQYYISDTSLHFNGQPIDALEVPGIVVPRSIVKGVKGIVMGCKGRVTRISTGKLIDVVVFDEGPSEDWDGEVTPPVAFALGFNPDPRHGGLAAKDLLFELWPGIPAVVNGITYNLQAS